MAGIETQILWLVQQSGSLHQLLTDVRAEMREGREATVTSIAELKVQSHEMLRRQDGVNVILARIYPALRNMQRSQTRGTTGVHTATSTTDPGRGNSQGNNSVSQALEWTRPANPSGNSQGNNSVSQALEWTRPANPMPLPDSQPAANGSSNGIVRLAPPLSGGDRLETESHRRSCPDTERTVEHIDAQEWVWPQSQQDGIGEDESNSTASAATSNDSASLGRFGQAPQDDVERHARIKSLVCTIASQLQHLETQGHAVAWQLQQMGTRVAANGDHSVATRLELREGQQAIIARLGGCPSFAIRHPAMASINTASVQIAPGSIIHGGIHIIQHQPGSQPNAGAGNSGTTTEGTEEHGHSTPEFGDGGGGAMVVEENIGDDPFADFVPSLETQHDEARAQWNQVCGSHHAAILAELEHQGVQERVHRGRFTTPHEMDWIEQMRSNGSEANIPSYVWECMYRCPPDEMPNFFTCLSDAQLAGQLQESFREWQQSGDGLST